MHHPSEEELFSRFESSFEFSFDYSEVKKSENPDFLVQRKEDILGVEITEIFKEHDPDRSPAPLQAIETGWEKTCNRALQLWNGHNLPNIEVSVDFNDRYHVNDSNFEKLAEFLVKTVAQNLPDANSFTHLRSEDFHVHHIPDEVHSMTISRFDGLSRSYWNFGHGGIVPDVKVDQIKSRITKKNKRIPDYLKKCDKVWLLLVIHGWRGSSFLDLTEEVINHSYGSKFDRTILFHTLTQQVVDLK